VVPFLPAWSHVAENRCR